MSSKVAHNPGAGPVSVVVATRDRPQLLAGCLDSLLASLSDVDEMIVVDSGSVVAPVASVALERGARLLRCERPGASLARNVGWRAARHEVVAFVDDDVRVSKSWGQALRGVFLDNPQVGFVTGRLGLSSSRVVERPVAWFDLDSPIAIGPMQVGDFGHGANMAVRKSALELVGGFDQALGPGTRYPAAEDLDLFDRLLAAGVRGMYEPALEALHLQWRTRRQLVQLEWRYGIGQGARLARLWRTDRERAMMVARRAIYQDGLVDLAKAARQGYEFAAISAVVRLAGIAVGASWPPGSAPAKYCCQDPRSPGQGQLQRSD